MWFSEFRARAVPSKLRAMSKPNKTKKKTERESTFAKALGARIAMLRAQKKWSQDKLAERCGVVAYTISKIETGHADTRIGTLRRVASALSISLPELLDNLEATPAGGTERRKINEIVQLLLREDAETIDVIRSIVGTVLRMGKPNSRKRKPHR